MKLEIDRKIILSFIPFVIIAFFFWTGTILTRSHLNSKTIWLKLTPPASKVLLGDNFIEAKLKLSGVGFNLLTIPVFNKKKPLEIMLEEDEEELNKEKVIMLLNNQIKNPGISIEEVVFPSLKINMAARSNKKVPVKLNAEIDFEKYFGLKEKIILIPDSILISGPDSLIENIFSWETEKVIFNKLRSTISTDVKLEDLPEYVISNTSIVTLSIPVESYTEKILTVPILVQGNNSEYFISSPANIEVTLLVGISRYESIGEEDFTAAIFITSESQLIAKNPVIILNKPDDISIQFIRPAFVDVLPKQEIK